jgi:outer membrane murein-binding lipoprotein Lpp
MFQTANDIKAKRMKEGGVTEKERAAAAGAKEQAEGSLRALEDLMLSMEKSSVKAGGGDKGAAAAINEALKSGLYSDEDINKLSENGNPLQALLDDISKKMKAASKDAKTWDSVLKQYNKEQEEAKKETDKS